MEENFSMEWKIFSMVWKWNERKLPELNIESSILLHTMHALAITSSLQAMGQIFMGYFYR